MKGSIEPKREHIYLRLDAKRKRKLERAAAYEEPRLPNSCCPTQ